MPINDVINLWINLISWLPFSRIINLTTLYWCNNKCIISEFSYPYNELFYKLRYIYREEKLHIKYYIQPYC